MGRTKFRSRNVFRAGKKKLSKRRIKQEILETPVDRPTTRPEETHQQIIQDQTVEIKNSASARKLSLFGVEVFDFDAVTAECDSQMNSVDDDEYILVQGTQIMKLFSDLLCPMCKQPSIQFMRKPEDDLGFAARMAIECRNCKRYSREEYSSQRIGEPGSLKNAPFDVNARATVAFRGVGCGHSAMKEWCGVMNMSAVLSKNAYTNTNNKLEEAASKTFESVAQNTRELLKEAYAAIGVNEDKDGILDVAVSFDGTWQKRGHTSHNGAACTIDLLTGLPIDIEVLSNYCAKCSITPDDVKNQEWLEKHAKVCSKNFNGTSGAMEVEAAERLWTRSVEKHNVRYRTMLSDGDSKAFDALAALNLYGDEKPIEKEDCINHVSKRMGTALRNMVAVSKAQKNSISGKGKLTQAKIKRIQNYYGKAIKDHSHDVKICRKRIKAILFHLSSTDDCPKHTHCPEGANSWCFWQRAKASGDVPGAHKEHDTLPPEIGSRLVPIFQRLSDEKLLQRCSRKKTQNPNESLHQLIWKICPKSIYVGRRTLKTAVALAACQFSMGATFKVLLLNLLGMEAGESLKRFVKEKDCERIKLAEKASSEAAKKHRKKLKYEQIKVDQKAKKGEGETYGAGLF